MTIATPLRIPLQAHLAECQRIAGRVQFADAMIALGFAAEVVVDDAKAAAERDARDADLAAVMAGTLVCGKTVHGRG